MRLTNLRVGLLVWILGVISFEATAAQTIALAWNANSESDLAGYRLHYGTTSKVYSLRIEVAIPAVPSATVSASVLGLQSGRTYYFAVTALNREGMESGYSQEVSYSVPNPGIPPVVTESYVVPQYSSPDLGPPPTRTDEVVEVGAEPPPDDAVVIMASSSSGPRLEIVPIGRPVVAFFLSFEAPANRECQLQVSRDLVSWQPLVPFTAAAASRRFAFTDRVGSELLRFYRLRVF